MDNVVSAVSCYNLVFCSNCTQIQHILATEKLHSVFNRPKCSNKLVERPHGKFWNKALKVFEVYDWLTEENITKCMDRMSEAKKTVNCAMESV